MNINLFHLFIIFPALLVLSAYKTAPKELFYFFMALGVVLAVYHTKLAFDKKSLMDASTNILHVVLVAPLLIAMGYNKKIYPMTLQSISILGALYHTYRIYQKYEK